MTLTMKRFAFHRGLLSSAATLASLLVVLPVLAIAPAAGADAQSWNDLKTRCADAATNADLSIDSCTPLIQSDQLNLAIALHKRGTARVTKGQFDLAIADFDEAIRLQPEQSDSFYNRGLAFYQKGQYGSAIHDFDKAIQLAPKDAAALVGRGAAYRESGQYERAIDDFNEAIKLEPHHATSFAARGLAYDLMGQHRRAIEDYDQAIRIEPDPYALNRRGIVNAQMNQHDRAMGDFNEAIRRAPDFADAFYNRCLERSIANELAAALADCNEAVRLSHGVQPDIRGFVYLKMQRFDLAVADFGTALQNAPSNAFALYGRGLAKRMIGDTAGADADTREAQRIDPMIHNMFGSVRLTASRDEDRGAPTEPAHHEFLPGGGDRVPQSKPEPDGYVPPYLVAPPSRCKCDTSDGGCVPWNYLQMQKLLQHHCG
jgi:tetratricopeptide (TPR) repeat protein